MQRVLTNTGLVACFQEVDRATVERELRRIDAPGADRLFLDLERDEKTGGLVWTVKEHVGPMHPPHTLLLWRDERGRPLPLSLGVVHRTAELRQFFGRNIHAEATHRNDEHLERVADEGREERREIARDFERHRLGNFALVPRSPGLARTRARMRSEGKAK